MRSLFASVLMFVFSVTVFAQSRTELIEYGDQEFKNKNYASAAYFYLKVINETTGKEKDVVYPYEIKESRKYIIKKKEDTTSTEETKPEVVDSSMIDFIVEEEEEVDPEKERYDYIIHQVADCYRLGRDYQKAEQWFKRSMENKPKAFKGEQVYYAECLIMNGKYDQALVELEEFTENSEDKTSYHYKRAQQLIFNCGYAEDPNNMRTDIAVYQLDSTINKGSSNFAASFYHGFDSFIISSGREGNMTPEDQKKANPENYSDLYIIKKGSDGWDTLVEKIPEPMNSEWNEGAAILSVDRTSLYFTRWNPINKNECHIWVCKKFNGIWMQPLKLGNSVNLDGYRSMHPMLSEEGDVLYYASDRPNGYGKMDLWYCTINEYGELGPPINLGSDINGPENEGTPFHHYYTNTMFFSSDGHTGLGGLDVFKSKFNEDDSVWTNPINLGQPINSSKDDMFYILDKDQGSGYFTSDRDYCENCNEEAEGGYCLSLYELGQPELEFSISGYVYNAETEEIIPNALITFKDVNGVVDPFFLMTDEKGFYKQELKLNQHFFMKAQKVKFFGDAATVSTEGLTESKHFIQDFYLTPIPAGEIEIPGIEYDYDAATLRPESKEILDDLVEFLNLNDNLVIEIRSHTDSRGDDAYNQRLSEERAKSCVDYLTANGIPRDRMIPIGFGETELLKDCSGVEGCGDTGAEDCECHQRNRRTAFKPIAQDYIDIESTGGDKSGGFKAPAPKK